MKVLLKPFLRTWKTLTILYGYPARTIFAVKGAWGISGKRLYDFHLQLICGALGSQTDKSYCKGKLVGGKCSNRPSRIHSQPHVRRAEARSKSLTSSSEISLNSGRSSNLCVINMHFMHKNNNRRLGFSYGNKDSDARYIASQNVLPDWNVGAASHYSTLAGRSFPLP